MADTRIINLTIAGKKYPVWVDKNDEKEEEIFRLASKIIKKKMDQYQKKFSNRNIFDTLAMTTLQSTKELIEAKNHAIESKEMDKLIDINNKLDEILEE
ncbi:MAG: cell division protein ZapA [Bacteroidota bacterium]|nr:cell division protein ZapA [Bacteroidota bacterium]